MLAVCCGCGAERAGAGVGVSKRGHAVYHRHVEESVERVPLAVWVAVLFVGAVVIAIAFALAGGR